MSGLLHSNYPVDAGLIDNITYVMMMGPNKAIKHEIAKCFLKKVYISASQKKRFLTTFCLIETKAEGSKTL